MLDGAGVCEEYDPLSCALEHVRLPPSDAERAILPFDTVKCLHTPGPTVLIVPAVFEYVITASNTRPSCVKPWLANCSQSAAAHSGLAFSPHALQALLWASHHPWTQLAASGVFASHAATSPRRASAEQICFFIAVS
jgi:hypothetical protein